MNALLLGAAALIFAIGAAHSYLGERLLLVPLFRLRQLPPLFGSHRLAQGTLRAAWHVTTVAWWGIAALLIAAARDASGTVSVALVGAVIATTAFASGVVMFAGTRGRHLSWIVFLIIALLVWRGTH